jgi:UDP-N-acetylmuramoyl-tripeptide--D-alanyl-D-alanine ligase
VSEPGLTAAFVCEATAGVLVAGDGSRELTGVSVDTRTAQPGELYVALRGSRFDGADFAAAALEAGAAGVLVPSGRGRGLGGGGRIVIEVDDTLAALQRLGRRVRNDSGARVVAITGSAGKTTTKEVTADFLSARYRVVRNRGNLNNEIGLPLSLIELRRRPELAVVELGMNHAGEIRRLVGIASPEVRVWTNVGEAHLGFFKSIEEVADAKAEILEDASSSTILVANADDPRVTARVPPFAGRVVTFGIDRSADVRAVSVSDGGLSGTKATIATPHGAVEIATPLVGRGNLANVLAATAVAIQFDVPLDAIRDRASRLRPAPHRGEVIRLPAITVIDDTYNANPTATRSALQVLMSEPGANRRVAVLGEMLELGDHAMPLHEDVGRAAAAAGVDVLVAVGGAPAAALAQAAVAAGIAAAAVQWLPTSAAAAGEVARLVRPGDVVLVKGSRSVGMDTIVERLKAERD